jgi:calnexin
MRFTRNVAFGLFTVAVMGFGNVVADELDDLSKDAAAPAAASASSVIEKPTFTVSLQLCAASFTY